MAKKQFLDYIGLVELKAQLEQWLDKNKTVTFNYSFDVDKDGNLIVIYPDDESAPEGFSVNSEGYLVYTED